MQIKHKSRANITSIGASAFENCTNLASINLPNGLESIGEKAFAGCTSLTKITVPESLTTMGTKAFEGCINVSEVNFNASYCNDFTADNNIFSNLGTNTDGVTVIFGNTVRKIPSYLLYELAQIKNITIADNVSEIGNYAFSGCNQITEISLPASLETFGHGVFFGCSNLSNLSIASNDMFSTENGALYTSDKSKLIYVPEKCNLTVSNLSTVEVEPYAYYNNQVVTLVNLMFVTTIGEKAFYNCKELQYVFSGSLLTIGDYALADCTKLSMFSAGINLIDMGIGVIDNTLIEKNSTGILAFGKVLYQYNGSDAVLTKQSIPSTVTKISSYAFSNNTDITEIYLPNNIDNIEQNAFYNCPNLVKVQYENFALPNINGNIFVNVDESFNFYCARILINEMSNSGSWQKYESISVPITTSVYFEDINLNQTYYYGEINYPPEGEKEGHYFYGWFEKLDENPDGTPIMATVPISIEIWNRTDTGLTYVGKYIESNNFDLIFMNGEEVVGTAHISSEHSYLFEKFGVTINGVYQDFNGKLKMDYFYYNGVFALNLANGNDEAYCEFDGWWNGNKEYTAGNTWGNAFTDSSIYLYAKWSPVEYICTLDYNGGIVQDTQIEFTYFSDIDLPIPTSTEGVFLAWEKDGQTYETLGGFIGDITLNASWKTVFIIKCVSNSYIVKTFTLTGGYTQYITLPELDYQGYYVSKWGVYAAGSDYLVIQDIILNALWEEKDIARCYNTNTSFYEIWTFNQFKAIGTTKFPSSVEGYVILGNYRLMADITFPGTWETFTYSFSGVLDGNNKTIKRLIINSTSSSVCWGLFASIRDGEVYDLTIDVFDITLPENISSATGIIAGINDGIISNITLKNGAITCRNYESSVGGICGSNGGTVSNITIDSTVYICGSGTSLGGAVGTNYSYVENVTCSAEIEYIWNTINGSVGGIVGYNHENIEECIFNGDIYWTCEIRDKNILPSIGMICGWNEKGTLSGNDISGGTAHIDCESYYFLGIMIWDQNGRVMKKENGQTGWGNY